MVPPKKNPAAAALGKLGGAVKSDGKAEAARANGKKGGRPRKNPKASPPPRPKGRKRKK